jgi:hypothetical protein
VPRVIANRPYFLREEIMVWLRNQPQQGRDSVDATHA